jgi:hypothetical protein
MFDFLFPSVLILFGLEAVFLSVLSKIEITHETNLKNSIIVNIHMPTKNEKYKNDLIIPIKHFILPEIDFNALSNFFIFSLPYCSVQHIVSWPKVEFRGALMKFQI